MSTWLTFAEIPVPQPPPASPSMADYMLALGCYAALENADLNFLAATPDPEYASPVAYLNAMTAYAKSLLQNTFPVPYAPAGWDAATAARNACMSCFNIMAQLPVNAGDPNTVSVFMAWVTGTGQLYGGHPAVPAPTTQSTGTNEATGQSSAPAGSIL